MPHSPIADTGRARLAEVARQVQADAYLHAHWRELIDTVAESKTWNGRGAIARAACQAAGCMCRHVDNGYSRNVARGNRSTRDSVARPVAIGRLPWSKGIAPNSTIFTIILLS